MRMSTRVRRTLVTIAAATLVITGTLSTASAANARRSGRQPSRKMAALGDSITQALMTCSSLSGCPANSWSTGTTASVNSHLPATQGRTGAAATSSATTTRSSGHCPAP